MSLWKFEMNQIDVNEQQQNTNIETYTKITKIVSAAIIMVPSML